jgi:ABC-type sugar transport system ATPase subunit
LQDVSFDGVGIGTKAEIYALFNELVQEGIGILVISSDLPEVLALADRILIMRHGHLAGDPPEQMRPSKK